MRRTLVCACALLLLLSGRTTAQPDARPFRTRNVVLVTLDGARWQEVFGGLDETLLRSTLPADANVATHASVRKYGAGSAGDRRRRLLPFFWGTLMTQHGFVLGNRGLGSQAAVTNRHWFSYPGYSEILTGQAHDDTIKSNDAIRNPYPSVLQFVRRKLGLAAKDVATFSSWDAFPAIVESTEGETTVNSAFQRYDTPASDVAVLNDVARETPAWGGVRYDTFTMRFALDYLTRQHPRLLYVALDETDDYAHDGKYDQVLDAYARTDAFLNRLWDSLQRDSQYRDQTTLIVTTDHGRGRTAANWRNHGARVEGADEIWMAFVSPDTSWRGERTAGAPVYQNQLAATIAHLFGLDYREQNPQAGETIKEPFAPVSGR